MPLSHQHRGFRWVPALLLALGPFLWHTDGHGQLQPGSAREVLQFMPGSATLAFSLPPATALYAQAHTLEARLSGLGEESFSRLLGQTEQWLQAGGIPSAEAMADLLLSHGFDPHAASGLFLELSPASTRAREAIDLIASGRLAWDIAAPETEPGPDCNWLDLGLTHAVAVLGCRDTALVLSAAERFAASLFADEPRQEEPWESHVIYLRGRVAYAVHEHWLFAANDVSLLKEVLALTARPVSLPAIAAEPLLYESNRVMMLTRMSRLRSLLPELTALYRVAANPGQDPAGTSKALRYPEDVFNDASPCITTLDVSGAGIEVTSRLDLAAHPKFAALCGDAHPIRLGAVLPEECPLFICVHWTKEGKALFEERWSPLLDEGGVLQTLFTVFEGEMALGIAVPAGREPQLFLLAEINGGNIIRDLVGAGAGWEDISGVPGFQAIQVDPGLFLALSEDTLLITRDSASALQILPALKEGKPSPMLNKRTPPISTETPIFGVVSAQTDGLETAVRFLAEATGGEAPEFFLHPLSRTFGVIRELRAGRSVVDGWQVVCLAAYFR